MGDVTHFTNHGFILHAVRIETVAAFARMRGAHLSPAFWRMWLRNDLNFVRAQYNIPALTPPGSEWALGFVFPDHPALAVHFHDATGLMARHQKVAIGQAGRRGYLGDIHFQKQLAVGVELGDLVAAVLGDQDAAVGQQVNPGVAAIGVEGFELFALGIEADTLTVLAHADDVAIAGLVGGRELAQVVDELAQVVDRDRHILALAIHFDDLDIGGNEGVAIGQALDVVGIAVQLFLPQNFALEIAFGHHVGGVFGD